MTQATEDTVWIRTEFAFGGGDQCQCYKHRTRNGNRRRCAIRNVVIGLQHPDQPDIPMKLFCLDCWAQCRTERTISKAQATQPGFGLISIGC